MTILGMDEVGRGSWAGPVVVGAVALSEPIVGLRDSKQLSVKSREMLAGNIQAQALIWSTGLASAEEIDDLGLTQALGLAYQRALARINQPYDEILIDGHFNFLRGTNAVRTLIKADQLVPAVSAASIIAKVARDELMANLATEYPGYGFERHVGYGTAAHAAALRTLGACEIHRRSFRPVQEVMDAAS